MEHYEKLLNILKAQLEEYSAPGYRTTRGKTAGRKISTIKRDIRIILDKIEEIKKTNY